MSSKKSNKTPKKKSNRSTSSKPEKNANKNNSNQVSESGMSTEQKIAILIFSFAIILAFLAFVEGSRIWMALHGAYLGIFGYCAYIWPALLIYFSVLFALEKPRNKIISSFLSVTFFVLLLGGLIHLFGNDEELLKELSLLNQISAAWSERTYTFSGGVIGALVGGSAVKLFGYLPSKIILIVISLASLMFATKISLQSIIIFFSNLFKKIKEKKETARIKAEEVDIVETDNKPVVYEEKGVGKRFSPPRVLSEEEFAVNTGNGANLTDDVEIIIDTPIKSGISGTADIDNKDKGLPSEKKSENLQTSGDIEANLNIDKIVYQKPPTSLLTMPKAQSGTETEYELKKNGEKLINTLESFGIQSQITMISRGPTVTRYELQPSPGIRISRITKLADDIAMNLAAGSVRIEAPIPNKSAIGIEIPNIKKNMVYFREIIESEKFGTADSKLDMALGKDVTGNIICSDLDKMPHLLIAGTTGSGKSVCMNSLIASLLYNATPDEVKLILIDAKQGVELGPYNGIAHLAIPVVEDPRKAAGALSWALNEVEKRYILFNEYKVRNIASYNRLAEKNPDLKQLHRIVIFIDELNDLMMVAPREVEEYICRIAQKARASGIHLVIATQRPSVDVITGVIKANIPSRIALSVASYVDSRTIIDTNGAEKLLGNGDMLFSPVGMLKPIRLQGCFISDKDIEKTVSYIKSMAEAVYDEEMIKDISKRAVEDKKKAVVAGEGEDGEDELLYKAIEVIAEAQVASTTFLQRKLKVGYARAANLMDVLEERRIVGPPDGSKPRNVLITKQQWLEMYALGSGQDDLGDE